MEEQSGMPLWKKRRYNGEGNVGEDLPSFEEVSNEQGQDASDSRMHEAGSRMGGGEQASSQNFASTSTSKLSNSLSSSTRPPTMSRSRLSRFSTTSQCNPSSASTSQPSTSFPSPFTTNSNNFSSSRRGPAPSSVLYGEAASSNPSNSTMPSRKVPLTSEQSKLFNTAKSTAPLRVYTKPSTGGLVAAGGLGSTVSIDGPSSREGGSWKAKERIEKKEVGNSGGEQLMNLGEITISSSGSDSGGAASGPAKASEEMMERINQQFHGRPPSPSSASSSSGPSPARQQPRRISGKALAARKSSLMTRKESEEEWEDEEDEEGGSEAEVQSLLVPRLAKSVSTRQPPTSDNQSALTRIQKDTARKASPRPPISKAARKSAPTQSQSQSTRATPSHPATPVLSPPLHIKINDGSTRATEKERQSQTGSTASNISSTSSIGLPRPSSKSRAPDPQAGASGSSTASNDGTPEFGQINLDDETKDVPIETDDGQDSLSQHLLRSGSLSTINSTTVGTSKRMLRTRSSEGKVESQKLENSMRQTRTMSTNSTKAQKLETVHEKKKWVDLIKIDEGDRVEVPVDWQPKPQAWLVDDPEDSINECIHPKQLLLSLDRIVICSSSAARYDVSKVVVNVSIEARNTTPGFSPTMAISSKSVSRAFLLECTTRHSDDQVKTTFKPDPDNFLTSKPISLSFDPKFCRKAGTISLSVLISVQLGSALLETRHTFCSVSSTAQQLIPRSSSPFLHFDEPDSQSGISVSIDIVPVRKQIKTAAESRIEIERRLARMELDRERIWVPDAQAIRSGDVEDKTFKMLNLGKGCYSYDFITKLPYRPGETVRNFRNDTAENTARFVEAKDEEIDRTSANPSEKLLARARMRWGLLNPYPPSIFDRELTCWIHYAPLIAYFSLRFELGTLLLSCHLKYRLLTESEICQILLRYDVEKKKIERGERRNYEEMRREAMWKKEMGKNA